MNRVNFAILIYFSIAALGCIWQIEKISHQYFDYEVVTQLEIKRPKHTTPPSLTICFRLPDVLPGVSQSLSLEKIYSLTPSVERMFNGCTIRKPGGFLLDTLKGNKSACETLFKIEKFIKQRYVCYTFSLRAKREFAVRHLTNSLDSCRFYSIYLEEKFSSANYVYFFLTSKRMYGLSNSFTEHFRRIRDNITGHATANYVTISYRKFVSHLMKPPYKTMCVDYPKIGFESASECYDECLKNSAVDGLQKLPFEAALYEAVDLPLISKSDLANANLSNALHKFEKQCENKCKQQECLIEDFSPKIIAFSESHMISLEMYASNEPIVITTFLPLSNIIDYVTFVLSCISFWFGWSPLYFMKDINLLDRCKGRKRDTKVNAQIVAVRGNIGNFAKVEVRASPVRLSLTS